MNVIEAITDGNQTDNVISLGERRLNPSAVIAKQLHDDEIVRKALCKRLEKYSTGVIETSMFHALRARGRGLSLETSIRLGEAIARELTSMPLSIEGEQAKVDAAFRDGSDAA